MMQRDFPGWFKFQVSLVELRTKHIQSALEAPRQLDVSAKLAHFYYNYCYPTSFSKASRLELAIACA